MTEPAQFDDPQQSKPSSDRPGPGVSRAGGPGGRAQGPIRQARRHPRRSLALLPAPYGQVRLLALRPPTRLESQPEGSLPLCAGNAVRSHGDGAAEGKRRGTRAWQVNSG